MAREPIPEKLRQEHSRVRNLGGFFNIVIPMAKIIAVLILGKGNLVTELESRGEFCLLRYGLVVFSVTICIAARVVLGRMMTAVREAIRRGVYRTGRLTYSYLAVYALNLVPTVWGFAYFVLTGGSLAFVVLASITVLAFLFLTPGPDHYWS